jgi:hypothetical protein
MSRTNFRILLIASAALRLLGAYGDHLFPEAIPSELSSAYRQYFNSAPVSGLFVALGLLDALGLLAAYVGLYFFRGWSRPLALGFTVLGVAIAPLFGPAVASGVSIAVLDFSSALWGAALAIAYFSPVKEHFLATAR